MRLLFWPVAVLGLAWGAFCVPAAAYTPAGVKLSLKVPPVVEVRIGGDGVPATLLLSNSALTDAELTVANPCKVRLWRVLDGRGVSVGDKDGCSLDSNPQSRTLAGGESVSETVAVPINREMLRENETYTLQYRFWDILAVAKFKIKLVK